MLRVTLPAAPAGAGAGIATAAGFAFCNTLRIGDPLILQVIVTGNYTLAFVWAGADALRYHVFLRRRAHLGLAADPVVRNRFLVWGATMASAGVLTFAITLLAAAGLRVGPDPLPTLLALVGTVLNALGWTLSFLPPEAYLRAVRARAARPAE